MPRKLIVFDIDGTLVNSQNTILPSSIEAVKHLKEQGHVVTIATGRTRFLVKNILEILKLDTYVLCNGAIVFHDNKPIISKPLDKKELKRLSDFMNTTDMDLAMTAIDQMVRLTSNHPERIRSVLNIQGGTLPELDRTFKFVDNHSIYQGLGFYPSVKDGTFEENFPELRFVRWHPDSVDIIARDNSKAVSVLALANYLNIRQEDIIAFGDGNNDIEILSEAGIGIAMGNASDQIKSVADMVTDTNERDGIYKALAQLKII